MADEEQRLRDIQREYLDFLDDEVRKMLIKHNVKTLLLEQHALGF